MATLGIKDKNYRPNQYINPMLISQKKEPAMGYGPYKIFDKNNPEHPDYKADDDDDEDMQLSLPLDYVKNKRNQDMTIAGAPNFPGGGFTTTSGAFVDLSGEAYYLDDGELIPEGGYDPAIHGELIPGGGPDRVDAGMNQGMMIAQGPELGGTGRLLTISEYNNAVDNAFSNLMNSDMKQKDFDHYLKIKETARRQMIDGV